MQKGNELAVKTFQINNTLQEIINNIYFLESQTQNQVIQGNIQITKIISDTISNLRLQIASLQKLTAAGSAQKKFTELNSLLQKKIAVIEGILSKNNTKELARQKQSDPENKTLIDGIYIAASNIQTESEFDLQETINENTALSKQVLISSRSLTIFALITILLSATLIFRHLKRNSQLIDDLKTARENADLAGNIKEQFLANMSHEIRTPLNSIIGFSNLASKTQLNGEQKDYIQFIKKSGENLLYIINDILDFSKLEAGKLQISKVPFNLKDICRFVEMLFQVQLSEKKIYFSILLEEDIPLHLTGDDDRLKQVLTNLLSNAIKFTGPGGTISLKIYLAARKDETVSIRFTVKDSGIGIPDEKLKTVFERFEQADLATTRKYGGTGLGLSIVKHLVTLQNGEVSVKSKINEGSEFSVMIPYTINAFADQEQFSVQNYTIKTSYNKNARILIAEDNRMNQLLLKYLFQQWGIVFTLAKDGEEAIQLIEKNEYDIVLLDIQMPLIDGFGVVKWIREVKKITVPVIAMTAHTLSAEIEKGKQSGMTDFLYKPLKEENVITIFNTYIPAIKIAENEEKIEFKYVNKENIMKLFGNNHDIINDLLELFINSYSEDLLKLNQFFKERDMEKIFNIAHNLKTTVSSLKTDSVLLARLKAIEHYRNIEPNWAEINRNINELNILKEQVITEIKQAQSSFLN